jgi:signal transduction histidine kinase
MIVRLCQALSQTVREADLTELAVTFIPQALSIRFASLWLADDTDATQLRLAGSSAPLSLPAHLALETVPSSTAEVDVLTLPFNWPEGVAWRAVVRLRNGSQLIGVCLLGDKIREGVFSDKDVRVLRTLAGGLATRAANLNHLDRERRLLLALADKEDNVRRLIAAELHDEGITQLSVVRRMVESRRKPEIIMAGLERVIQNIRVLSRKHLEPVGLEQGFLAALEAFIEQTGALNSQIQLCVNVPETLPHLSATADRELFFITQEAVTNAVKYSNASLIQINIRLHSASLELTISDNGQGFDPAPLLTGRETRGLGIMQARASRLQASLAVTSIVSQGTTVVVDLPEA